MPQQLRFPTDLALQVRVRAQMRNIQIQEQILHYVIQGIECEERHKGEEVTSSHIQSQAVIPFSK